MHSKLIKYLGLILMMLFVNSFQLSAQDYLPEKPKKETSVYDLAKMMSESESGKLERKLINYSDTTSTQIVAITVVSLDGNEIGLYATELAHKWGIGQKDKDNGIVLLVSKDDRRITIRTGYGVEHKLTDALSRRIIENVITPAFKQGNFYKGLDDGTTAIMQVMSGEYQGERKGEEGSGKFPAFLFVIIFIVIMMILSRKRGGGKNGGRRSGGFSLLDAIILSSAGRGGFGGGGFGGGSSSGSSSGGGFGGGGFGGGFGGGGFGGGGASGGW